MHERLLILASSSIYRRELLARLRLSFECVAPDLDETALPHEAPAATALRLALAKARAVARLHPQALIIGSDQVADLDGEPLGKPGDHDNAIRQLRAMRGQRVKFHTALCLLDAGSGQYRLENVGTTVQFRNLSDAQIERYLQLEKPYDCAGSAKVETLGIALAEKITSDDPTALIGLPLIALSGMLWEKGEDILENIT